MMTIITLAVGFVMGFFVAIIAMCLIADHEEKRSERGD